MGRSTYSSGSSRGMKSQTGWSNHAATRKYGDLKTPSKASAMYAKKYPILDRVAQLNVGASKPDREGGPCNALQFGIHES